MSNTIYSFSRLGSYENCPYGYYLTYIKHERGENGTYGVLGGILHEIMESLEHGLISKEDALNKWNNEIEFLETLDELNFPTEKSKNNYLEDISLYLKSFKPLEFGNKEVKSESYFEIELKGHTFRGYIDLAVIDHEKKEIKIYDYKTSSKSGFTGKNLIKKCYQLILYATSMESAYPNYSIITTCFDMVKYARHVETGKIKERKDIMVYEEDEYERYFLEIPYNEENKEKFLEYIETSIKLIELDIDKNDWKANYKNKFFCNNLCSHNKTCKYINK
ncbi:PD-(D/E)XK nuclease family protein [Terrisporobacter sp.]|uniref:PD-(D/E)XK nuclease family protein n=1 Tax=Terrisporobacter sp. TaxID=1965305 RepID=UPI002630C329|nr:PD-(D/E)XK nuclease family protein [Terrisporobacter sp.]